MSVARHPRPPELVGVPIEEIARKFTGRYSEKRADWAAFEDAKIEGYKRAQHRFIGAGGSGKHDDPTVIPAIVTRYIPTMMPTFTQEKPQMHDITIAITSPAIGTVTPTNVPTHEMIRRARLNRSGAVGAPGSRGVGCVGRTMRGRTVDDEGDKASFLTAGNEIGRNNDWAE